MSPKAHKKKIANQALESIAGGEDFSPWLNKMVVLFPSCREMKDFSKDQFLAWCQAQS